MNALKSLPRGAMEQCLILIAAVLLVATPSKAATWGTTDASFFKYFGFTDDWTVFELGHHNVQIDNHSILEGDLGIGGAGSKKVKLEIKDHSNVGHVFLNSNAKIETKYDNHATVGGTSTRNLNLDLMAATKAYNYFKGLSDSAASTWTSSNSSLSSKLTLGSKNGQLKLDHNQDLTLTATSTKPVVFDIKNFSLNNGAILTLSGNANDEFVFNIYGAYTVNNKSQINLTGGLTPSDVIYNMVGKGGGPEVNNGSKIAGIVLSTQREVKVNNHSMVFGAVISNGLHLNNHSVIESPDN